MPAAFEAPLPRGLATHTPRRTGPEHRRRPPPCHRNEARGRCSYDGVLPKSVPDAPKHTGGSRTHAHEHRNDWRATRPGSR